MGTVKDFILSVKLREGLKFDHQVADLINVDSAKLANWKSRESLPTSYQKWYCDRYNIELKSGGTIEFQPTIQDVKLNLLQSKKGSLD